MNNILPFNNNAVHQKEPIYCSQDFRDYVGYKIQDVLSDECDCNSKLILVNEATMERVIIDIDKALDGETLFIMRR